MISSGIKRGLAVSAISALAVTGVPAIANAATLATQNVSPNVTLWSVDTAGAMSVKNDGTNTTVSLVATAPAGVEFVTFWYNTGAASDQVDPVTDVKIGTASRTANGEFQLEFTPPVGESDLTIAAYPSDAAGASTVGQIALGDAESDVDVSGSADAVEIAKKTTLGYFTQPNGGDYVTSNNVAGINGTTSQSGGNLAVTGLGVAAGSPAIAAGTNPAGQNFHSWSGFFYVDATALANVPDAAAPDQVLPVVTTTGNSSDAEGFTLYSQQIRGISATSTPGLPDSGTGDVTVKVTDQNGEPVAGAKVEREDANGGTASNGGFTDGRGEVTFTGATVGSHNYYVETGTDNAFTTGVDYRTSGTVTVSRPETVTFDSKDGAAFDVDEFDANDIRVQVKDAAGNPLAGQRFFYEWTFAPFVTTVDTTQTTAKGFFVTTGADGYASVPLPAAADFPDSAKATTINTTGGALTLNGYVNRDGSNPGQDPVDLGLATSTIKRGESVADWEGPGTTDRQLGTTQTFTGSVKLADGTVLAGRTLNVAYAPAGNSSLASTQPEGTTRLSATSARVVTNAEGKFSVAVTDPATPATDENGSVLTVTGVAGAVSAGKSGIGADAIDAVTINFKAEATPQGILLSGGPTNLFGAGATPGRPVTFTVKVNNAAGVGLAGQQVTLKTDHGFFTTKADGTAPTAENQLVADPTPAQGGLYGEWKSAGETITLTTDTNGEAKATVAIERDAGFDDDGLVTANITATSGTATNANPITVQFSTIGANTVANDGAITTDALNPGSVEITPDEGQANLDLPEARVGQTVDFDVFAKDQFGNLTRDVVVVSDDTGDAGFDGEGGDGTVSVLSQFTSSAAAVEAEAEDDTNQVITASWTQQNNTYNDTAPATPGFQAGLAQATQTVTDSADAIEWYQIDFATSTFTLTSDPEGEVPVGTAVTETIKVVDQKGNPVPGLTVEFIRQGPGEQDGDPNVARTTNVNGEAFYSFTGTEAGVARISAVVTDGTQNQTIVDTVSFKAPAKKDAGLRVFGRGAKTDVVKANAIADAAGARATLWVNGRKVSAGRLNAEGDFTFRVKDRNGNKGTKYVVKVSSTGLTKADSAMKWIK